MTTIDQQQSSVPNPPDQIYRAAFMTMNQGFSLLDIQFDETGRAYDVLVRDANPAQNRIDGVHAFIGKRMREFRPDTDLKWIERYAQVARLGETAYFEDWSEANQRWYEIEAFPVGDSGSSLVAIIYNDITTRKQAEEALRRSEALNAFRLQLGDALRSLADPIRIETTAARLLGEYLGANQVHYGETIGDDIIIHQGWGNGLPPMVGRFRSVDFGEKLTASHRTGAIQVVEDVEKDSLNTEAERQVLRAAHIGAYITVPLVKKDQWVATLAVHSISPRAWTTQDIELVKEVAERTWAAVERARAEAALSASEQKYRAMFEAIGEGVSILEVLFDQSDEAIDYRFVENNPAVERMTGVGNSTGKTVLELFPDFDREFIKVAGEVARTGRPVRFQHFVPPIDRWFDVHETRIGGESSRTVIAAFADITERKRREANLAFLNEVGEDLVPMTNIDDMMDALGAKIGRHMNLSRCLFAEILESEDKLIIIRDWYGPKFSSITGEIPLSQFVSESYRQKSRAGEITVVADVHQSALVDGRQVEAIFGITSFVNVPLLRDGQWRFTLGIYNAVPRDWREDEIELLRELTMRIWMRLERARAEDALRESERRLLRMINVPGVGVLTFSREGRLLSANDTFLDTVGYSLEELTGGRLTWEDFTPPEYIEASLREFQRVLTTGLAGPYEKEYFRKDGTRVWLMFVGADMGDGTLLEYAIDISDRKRAEKAVRESEEKLAIELADTQQLQRISSQLIQEEPISQLYAQILDAAIALMRSDMGSLQVLDPQRQKLRQLAWKGPHPDSAAFWETASGDTGSSYGTALTRGQRLIIPDVNDSDLLKEHDNHEQYALSGIAAIQSTPLIARNGRVVGMLSTHWLVPHTPGERELRMLDVLARQTADLIERARAEDALRESERFVQGVITSLPLVIYIFDLVTGQNRYLSPQVADLFGYTPEEMQASGSNLLTTFFHPDDQPRVVAYFRHITTSGKDAEGLPNVFHIEYRIRHRQQGWVWVESRDIVYARDTEGKPTLLLGTAENISERRTNAQALQESEQRLRLALEAAEMGTWEWHLETDEVYWNEQHFRLLGMEPQPLPIGPDAFFDHVHPTERERLRNMLEQAIAERSVYDAEFCAVREDGSQCWMSGYGRVVEEREGKPVRMSGVMFDVDERRQVEQALHQSEARLRAILESAKDYAIFTTDLDRRVNSWNRGAQAMFGYTEEEIMEQLADLLFTPEDRQRGVPEHEAQKATSEGRAENERWHSRQDGSRFYGSGVVTPLRNEAGSMVGLLKVMRDLTVQKRAEDSLREADQRKDEFLAMLAHELRNPMATVSNGLNILRLTGETDEVTSQTIGMMNRQVDHLVRLIDDLLDVSRISRNKIELKSERIELGALVAGAVEAIRPQYTALGKHLHLTPAPFPLYVQGDTTRLSQVVTNLLTNGLRYTGQQGQVWVSLASEAGEALLRVSDNGIGLSADQRMAIFELFVQADNSLARQQGGLGIGLTLVRRLLMMHNGRVEARSPGLGQGSEFLVYLPLLKQPINQTITMSETTASQPARHRILVIDDNADAALTLSMMLKLKGYEVHSRQSGQEGLQAAEALGVTVILCDIGMPEMDGYETARQIRLQPWGSAVTLIALTGYGQEEDKQRAREAGFDGHLIKPVDLITLTQLLDELP